MTPTAQAALGDAIKVEAQRLGFLSCGFSRAEFLGEEAVQLEAWLRAEAHGTMHYMAAHFDERTDPRRLVPGARTVLSVLKNYYPAEQQPEGLPKISTYAFGEDYHRVIKGQLAELLHFITARCGAVIARCFVDSAPVLDKAWARRAGLGWLGKNTNLIRPGVGSFFFVGEIILEVELPPDNPIQDYCGTCTRCIDACPTGALTPYRIDARRCISYLTIELKDAIPEAYRGEMAGWTYGCDICQDVCPWNRFAEPHSEPAFAPLPHVRMAPEEWAALSPSAYKKLTRPTALSRVRREKLLDNLGLVGGPEG